MTTSVIYVGMDVHKDSIAIATAEEGNNPPQKLGMIPNDWPKLHKMLKNLTKHGEELRVCYEAGPTGFGLYRRLRKVGIDCIVIAPSLVPKMAGDRVKTDRRDAIKLATFLRSGHLTKIHVPTEAVEAIRDLERARNAAKRMEHAARQQLGKFLLRHDRRCVHKAWTKKYMEWVRTQKFDFLAQQIVLADYVKSVEDLAERVARLTKDMEEIVEGTELAPLVKALQAFRGISLISAVTIAAEVGNDLKRFATPRQFASFVGLVPSEDTSGQRRRQGSITRCGNTHLRRIFVESAWHYRHRPNVSKALQRRNQGVAEGVRKIAWKTQHRLYKRMFFLYSAGKSKQKTVVALARELASFIWSIGQEEILLEGVT